jgi:hypothetical protein
MGHYQGGLADKVFLFLFRQKKKDFFFAKKKQKTFVGWVARCS